MATKKEDGLTSVAPAGEKDASDDVVISSGESSSIPESRKLGITATVFVILNKMIGTGSEILTSFVR